MPVGTGRKTADTASHGRDQIWAAIRKQGTKPFSVASLVALTKANNKTVRDYCRALTAGGFLVEQPRKIASGSFWTLDRDIGHEAPRVRRDGSSVTQGAVTEQLWRGMFMLKEFTFLDLIESSSITIPRETAKAYCKMLLATGYLRVLDVAVPSQGQVARYRLIRNNGPKPPQIQRVKQVFDPNTREVFAPERQL